MGAILSYFGRPYAAIGGAAGSLLGDRIGTLYTRETVVAKLNTRLQDGAASPTERADALVLLEALGAALSGIDLFLFVGELTCPYTEVAFCTTVLEALVRKHRGRPVVRVGSEVISVRVPGSERAIEIGADALWLKYDGEGVDSAGTFLQQQLAANGIVNPFVYCAAQSHDPIPGTERLTALQRAELFDAVARENIALAEAATSDRCIATYAHGPNSASWVVEGQFGMKAHGTATATVLLSHSELSEAQTEFAKL